ncbi:MAG: hypothetical protein K0U84_16140 [Actinomycetia bacterium]|nr:hypothetical protein [Actinomycetes bacterium]
MGQSSDSVERLNTGAGSEPTYDFEAKTQRWLDARPEELTAVMDPENVDQWCPSVFLHSELLDRGQPDGLGMALRLHTKGFLPHSFFFVARIVDVVPHRYMRVVVSGDFEGIADIFIVPDGAGSQFQLHWRIALMHPWLRPLVRALHWAFVPNHKWAVRHICQLVEAEVHRRREPGDQIAQARATFPHNLVAFRNWQRRRASAARWRY